jgi:hypothetical protein
VPVMLVVVTVLEESVGKDDVLVSLAVVIELEELAESEEVEVVLVVLPNRGVTVLKKLPGNVEVNVSEEP